ncbi:APC membrane recruitment protein 2 [Varanus komodoensis]|uniref:APC membrane recruitment protein 2 n=1 Tax=Varanus komodoensis TaxID=61221 RepID=UPI001CF7A4C4|nr:APC membrane recruitment protein 2 [Varanus komodoensis]
MDVHCECAEPTAVGEQPPPSGKLNKTAFKLFKRRKSGGAMPSIFGVRSSSKGKSGEGGGGQAAGMVRSKTHDGLAEVVLESGKKEEPGGGGGVDEQFGGGGAKESPSSCSPSAAAAAVGKSHSFFSLLRKNGRASEGGKGERPKGRGGLKGLFSSMRWHRRDKPGGGGAGGGGAKEDEGAEGQPSLLMPGSLTASLECIKEEAPRCPLADQAAQEPPGPASADPQLAPPQAAEAVLPRDEQEVEPQPAPRTPRGEDPPGIQPQAKESHPEPAEGDRQGTKEDSAITGDIPIEPPPPVAPECERGQETVAAAPDPSSLDPPSEPSIDRICLMFADVTSLKSFDSLTGCGDIIADPEDDVGSGGGSGGGGSDKSAAGVSKMGASKKPPSVVAYQGGGEEMASPEQVGDTCTPEFWDMLSQTEEKSQEIPGGTESSEASKDGSCARRVQDGPTAGKHVGLNQIPVHHNHKEDQKSREKEQQEAVPSSDEGYWDSTTPGPEEDNTSNIQKEVIPRDSYSGDALYDLYADPDENTATVTSAEEVTSVICCKPLSPVTTTCPVKTHTTSLKDSKIPISIKHFTSPHGSHGPDTSNSHHIIHHQPTKSEIPRTKIPVSKVLVHRASYRSLAGTTGKAATYHESAKK